MTVKELYRKFDTAFPRALSAEWDNDGLMCTQNGDATVRRVLLTLDVTEGAIAAAEERGCDLIISHHPLIFRPIGCIDGESALSQKLALLIRRGISVFSFHTRADAAEGGVNDCLASLLGVRGATPIDGDGIARIGVLDAPTALLDFARRVKERLGAPHLLVGDAHRTVLRVALVGGAGKDSIGAAIAAGADTLVSGELGYHALTDAESYGINLIEAGHYFTERQILTRFGTLLSEFAPELPYEIYDSDRILSV